VIGCAEAARGQPRRAEIVEGIVALVALSVMTAIVVSLPPQPWGTVAPVALIFPILLWIAARCQPAFAAAGPFVVSLTIVWTITFGIGHFGDPDLPIDDRILSAQAAILGVALCAYVLAALFAERRHHEAVLEKSEARLQEALTAGAVTAFEWDPFSGLSQRSENAAQILGFDPQRPFTTAQFLTRVHKDDCARFKALIEGVSIDNPSYSVTFRFIRPDGREVWLEENAKAEFDTSGHFERLKGLTRDITGRKQAEERQDLLLAELDHRVKNVLARVVVVANHTHQSNGTMEEFIKAPLHDGRKYHDQRPGYHTHLCADPGGRHGHQRIGDECRKVRCSIAAGRQRVCELGPHGRRRGRDANNYMARAWRPPDRGCGPIRLWQPPHPRSHSF
jgi:PAS domain S-box-containing protein